MFPGVNALDSTYKELILTYWSSALQSMHKKVAIFNDLGMGLHLIPRKLSAIVRYMVDVNFADL